MKTVASGGLLALALLLFPGESSAQNVDCNQISNLTPGQVCFLNFDLGSHHDRDCNRAGGCERRWGPVIVEIPAGFMVTNYELVRTEGFGTVSAQCNRSGSVGGSVTTSETSQSLTRMTEIRGQLQAEQRSCNPTTLSCQRIRGELEAVNRTISQMESVQQDVFRYGDNSGLRCSGYLRQRLWGPGARWAGYVRANLRYVGTPGTVQAMVQPHQMALTQLLHEVAQTPPPETTQTPPPETTQTPPQETCVTLGLSDQCTSNAQRNLPATTGAGGAPIRTTHGVRVRNAASMSGAEVGTVAANSCIVTFGCSGGWCSVRTHTGLAGYVAAQVQHEGRARQLLVNGC